MPGDSLGAWLDAIGVGERHVGRVFRVLHGLARPRDVRDLGRHARAIHELGWVASARIERAVPAPGGVERLVFALEDGARVEGVLLPNTRGDRVTLCLSSQVGCAMACRFCATGTLGLTRDLRAGEIVAQVEAARRRVTGSGRVLSHLVFMGMGEPLHAFGSVRDALRVLLDPHGQPFDRRKVTVSTVGLVDRMGPLLDAVGGKLQLALSLHAGTDATRRAIIPAARRYPMDRLKEAARDYEARRGGRLMVEYVVLPGVNDTPTEIRALAAWMRGLRGVVNLIPFNPFAGAPYRSPSDAEVDALWAALRALEVPVTVRWPRGRAAQGACGQLMLSS